MANTRHAAFQQKTAARRSGLRHDLVQGSLFGALEGRLVVDTAEPEPDASSDEWYTPPQILGWLGDIGHDPFWCEHSLVTAASTWDIRRGENALARPWPGVRIFANPPYSKKALCIEYMAAQARNGALRDTGAITALIPADGGERVWHNWIWGKDACVGFLAGRVPFVTASGNGKSAGLGGSALVLWGADRLAWQAEIADRAARSSWRERAPFWVQIR
jgi:hypothetical protein